jgi:hypothetical protein
LFVQLLAAASYAQRARLASAAPPTLLLVVLVVKAQAILRLPVLKMRCHDAVARMAWTGTHSSHTESNPDWVSVSSVDQIVGLMVADIDGIAKIAMAALDLEKTSALTSSPVNNSC